jgi:hypothetical protein
MKLFHSSTGLLIRYDEKKEDLILESIRELKNEINQPNSLFIGFGISMALHNLANLLTIKGYEDEGLKRKLIFKVVVSVSNLADLNIDEFLESFALLINEIEQRETKKYHILYPINISEGVFRVNSKIRINNIKFKVYSWESVQKKYQVNAMMKFINEKINSPYTLEHLKHISTPFIGVVYDKDSNSAFRRVEEKAEILRSILNFLEDDWMNIQLDFPSPLAKIRRVGHYGVFTEYGNLVEPFLEQSVSKLGENIKLNKTDSKKINRFIKELNSDTHIVKYSEAITASLRLYSSALDTSDYSNAFLSLWQCIELLTMLSTENYKMTDVVERILCLNDFKNPVTKYFINLSADRRNNLVHKGIFDNIEGQS